MKLKRLAHQFFILLFLIIIFLPSIGLFQKTDEEYIKKNLNRMPYQFPELKLTEPEKTDFSGIEKWYADKATAITTLSKTWQDFNYYLGVNTKLNDVVFGKNGWFFAGNFIGDTNLHHVDLYTGKEVPNPEDLRLFVNSLKRMNEIASKYNIPFIVLVAPDAIEIYSEYLPSYVKKKSHTSMFDQASQVLPAENINFIDVRPALLQAKKENNLDLYLRGDPHWNYLGAYIAYKELAKNVASKYGIHLKSQNLKFENDKTKIGFFAALLQRDDMWSTKATPDLSGLNILMLGRDINGVTKEMGPFDGNQNIVIQTAPYENFNLLSENRDSCLLICDSYSEAWGVYFHNDFYDTIRIHASNKNYNLSRLIEMYHPKMIVFELTSRSLYQFSYNPSPNLEPTSVESYSNNSVVEASINPLTVIDNKVSVNGWGYLPHQDAANSRTYLKLSSNENTYYYRLDQERNSSIKETHKDGTNLGISGFSGVLNQSTLPPGNYKASIIIVNGKVAGEKAFDSVYSIYYPQPAKKELAIQPKPLDWSLPSMPINEEVKTFSSNGKIWLANGWEAVQNVGEWTNAREATFLISSKGLPEKFKLELLYGGYVTPEFPKQAFEIYNEHETLLEKFDYQNGDGIKSTLVNIEQKRDANKAGYILFHLKILSPVATPPSEDTKFLGLRLMGLKILPEA